MVMGSRYREKSNLSRVGSYTAAIGVSGAGFSLKGGAAALLIETGREVEGEQWPPFSVCHTQSKYHNHVILLYKNTLHRSRDGY